MTMSGIGVRRGSLNLEDVRWLGTGGRVDRSSDTSYVRRTSPASEPCDHIRSATLFVSQFAMPKTDKRIDAYIENAADFARPILTRVREVVHEACPDVEETLKWGHPAFMYHGIMCGMAAFKEYCAFHFWKGALIIEDASGEQMWAQLGRLTKVSDLPIEESDRRLCEEGDDAERGRHNGPASASQAEEGTRHAGRVHVGHQKNKKALAGFEKFSPSHKREYIEWITDAKAEDTRNRRIAQAVQWMAEGKPRNWKYM
jgi:hypothetical protein